MMCILPEKVHFPQKVHFNPDKVHLTQKRSAFAPKSEFHPRKILEFWNEKYVLPNFVPEFCARVKVVDLQSNLSNDYIGAVNKVW